VSAGRPFRRSLARSRTLVLSAPISDGAPHREKEGAIRRRLVAAIGKCPCGAAMAIPTDLTPGSFTLIAVEHENDCPAIEDPS